MIKNNSLLNDCPLCNKSLKLGYWNFSYDDNYKLYCTNGDYLISFTNNVLPPQILCEVYYPHPNDNSCYFIRSPVYIEWRYIENRALRFILKNITATVKRLAKNYKKYFSLV